MQIQVIVLKAFKSVEKEISLGYNPFRVKNVRKLLSLFTEKIFCIVAIGFKFVTTSEHKRFIPLVQPYF